MGYFVDSLFRRPGATAPELAPPAPATGAITATPSAATIGSDVMARSSDQDSAEVSRIFMQASLAEVLQPEDMRYVGQLVAQRTGLSQQDAEKRVTHVYAKAQAKARDAEVTARDTADKARKASAYSALWLFVSLLIGAFVTGDVLHGPDYFPALAPAGQAAAQMFSSSPSGGSESMQLMYLLAVTAASRSIDLSAAYFVPDALTQQTLVAAMQRGVRLRIIVPGKHIDSETVRKASRATWRPLLVVGAVIAEYRPTMYHCKVMIVDGLLVSVGSTNFDNRSFRLNDEATLNVIDPAFATLQTATFEDDLANAQQLTHAQWLARPTYELLQETLASLLDTQL